MSLDDFSYREATKEDLPLILKWTVQLLAHESLKNEIELQLKDNVSLLLEEWLKNLISDKNTLIIIATDESKMPICSAGIIIGHIQLQPNDFTQYGLHGVIQMVWVDINYRNNGLASQLVAHVEETFVNMDVPYCEVQFSNSNCEADAFWSKSGYQKASHNCRKMLN